MAPYRGPNARRQARQFAEVSRQAGETAIWRQYVSAGTGTASAFWGGSGTTRYYRAQRITAMWAAPWVGEFRFREAQLAGGQVMAGDAVISTRHPLGSQDEIIWRGTTYRVEGDSVPVHLGERLWYRTVVRRGDATG